MIVVVFDNGVGKDLSRILMIPSRRDRRIPKMHRIPDARAVRTVGGIGVVVPARVKAQKDAIPGCRLEIELGIDVVEIVVAEIIVPPAMDDCFPWKDVIAAGAS